jgi:hypothetical protein
MTGWLIMPLRVRKNGASCAIGTKLASPGSS